MIKKLKVGEKIFMDLALKEKMKTNLCDLHGIKHVGETNEEK